MTLDSYEFTAEQNRLIADLARKMKGVAIFMAAIGAMALAGCVTSALRDRLDLAVIAALAAAFFLAIATWTFQAGGKTLGLFESGKGLYGSQATIEIHRSGGVAGGDGGDLVGAEPLVHIVRLQPVHDETAVEHRSAESE